MDWGRIEGLLAPGDIAVCIGGGPSLRGVRNLPLPTPGRFVIAVNCAMFDLVDFDVGVSVDVTFHNRFRESIARIAARKPVYIAVGEPFRRSNPPIPGVIYLRPVEDNQWHVPDDPGVLSGPTSGFAALTLALHKGARRIALLGYDYGYAGTVFNHAHDHYPEQVFAKESKWRPWANAYLRVSPVCRARGVKVINASPDSFMTAFPRAPLADVLAAIEAGQL